MAHRVDISSGKSAIHAARLLTIVAVAADYANVAIADAGQIMTKIGRTIAGIVTNDASVGTHDPGSLAGVHTIARCSADDAETAEAGNTEATEIRVTRIAADYADAARVFSGAEARSEPIACVIADLAVAAELTCERTGPAVAIAGAVPDDAVAKIAGTLANFLTTVARIVADDADTPGPCRVTCGYSVAGSVANDGYAIARTNVGAC